MRMDRHVVEKLAAEVHRIGRVRVRVHSMIRLGPKRRRVYTIRPEGVTYGAKTGSRRTAAYLLGVLVSSSGPGGELSPLAQEVMETLFPARKAAPRADVTALDNAFLRGRQYADAQIIQTLAA